MSANKVGKLVVNNRLGDKLLIYHGGQMLEVEVHFIKGAWVKLKFTGPLEFNVVRANVVARRLAEGE